MTDNHEPHHPDGDLNDLLGELRVLLPGTQTLTAFLVILPFNAGFDHVNTVEKIVFVVTFLCTVTSLLLFTAPAALHRLQRPLRDRVRFKAIATNYVIAGLIPLSIAIVLVSQLVISQVVAQRWVSWVIAAAVASVIAGLWWIYPLRSKLDDASRAS